MKNRTLEEEKNAAWELGKVSVLEGLPDRFNEQAGKSYAAGQDARAALCRELARTFKTEAEEARRAWDRRYGRAGK